MENVKPKLQRLAESAAKGNNIQEFQEAKRALENAINTVSPPPLQVKALNTVLQAELEVRQQSPNRHRKPKPSISQTEVTPRDWLPP